MYHHILKAWTRFVTRQPWTILVAIGLITLIALYIAVTQFSINSDTGRLIRQDQPWKETYNRFQDTFPQYTNNTFVVVSGSSLAAVSHVSRALERKLGEKEDIFQFVYSPANDDFLETHALLYIDVEELDTLVSELAAAQPVLTAVARDPGLRGFFGLLSDALNGEDEMPDGMTRFATLIADSIDRLVKGDLTPVAWRDELVGGEADETYYNIIFVQGKQNFGVSLPSAKILAEIRDTIERLEHPEKARVRIRLTGQIPLDHGEIRSAMNSASMAGTVAALFLLTILLFGVRSARVIAATYLAMVTGLIWTAAYAILAVGQYNTISIIFLVMFIGLGVDFAIHLSLRYQEELEHREKFAAILNTSAHLGLPITLCGITSAIGFLSFVPTEYTGLAELGIISGGGMIIAVFITLTVIPAFLAVTAPPRAAPRQSIITRLSGVTGRYRYPIIIATVLLASVSAIIGKDAYFDYSTLSLKDQHSEAMQTFRELQANGLVTDYAISFIAPDEAAALVDKEKLLRLQTVSEVRIPSDYVPSDQEEKLYLLEDAQIMLASTLFSAGTDRPGLPDDREKAIRKLHDAVDSHLEGPDPDEKLRMALTRLRDSLDTLMKASPDMRRKFESLLIDPLKQELDWLGRAINVDSFEFSDLPERFRDRLVTPDGRQLMMVTPAYDIVRVDAMRRFATEVRSVIPEATGRPVVELGIGDIVIESFREAIGIAVTLIFVILTIALRSILDAFLVFIPLVVTTLVTFAVSVLIDLPLNMANVVVIPLIFGLGVDNGIHVVERFHESPDIMELARSSTPRAVFLSTLTTLGTFGALSFSSHQGIFSIGILLTCALSVLMVLTLISLPALLAVFSTSRSSRPVVPDSA